MRKTPEIALSSVLGMPSPSSGKAPATARWRGIMPNFDRETLERWRRERVSDSTIPSRKVPLDAWQITTMLRVCEADLEGESRRLACSRAQVKESQDNIRSFKKKRERILARKAEMEGK
jgi:hypothetical protein